MHNAIGPV